jgi:hypothetical protein
MTVKYCIFCNKSIKPKKIKSLYCSNSCRQKNYKLKKSQNQKEIVKDSITQGFLREQQIHGFFFIQNKLENTLSTLEQNKRIHKEQDEYIKERKEFEKGLIALDIKRKTERTKLVTNMLLSSLISKPKSNDIKLSDLQFPEDI